MNFDYTIAGFTVGFIIGLTGVGGGSLMTPLLVLLFGIKPVVAVGTDLLYAAITKCGGVWVHHKKGSVRWRIVMLLALGSIPSSLTTVFVLERLSKHGVNFQSVITLTLSIALMLTSLVLLFKGPLQRFGQDERFAAVRALHARLQEPITVLAGLILGVLVTLSSVGAGALGAAILFFLYPRLPAVSIVGSDIAHAVPLTAVAGLGHLHLGTVDLALLLSLVAGSLPGVFIGSHLSAKVPEPVLRRLLAAMLFTIGARFAFA